MKTRSFITGQGTDFRRGEWARQWSTSVIEGLATGAQCRCVLHMGSLGVPLEFGSKLRHFIYLDSTYSLLASHPDAEPFNPRFEELENAALHRAECVFTVSEYVRNTVIQHYRVPPDRVICSGTGRGDIFPPKARSWQIIIRSCLSARRASGQKGDFSCLRDFGSRDKCGRNFDLRWSRPEENRALIEGCPGAQFRTKVSWNELQTLFQTAVLYAMPALYEPWGLGGVSGGACKQMRLAGNESERFARDYTERTLRYPDRRGDAVSREHGIARSFRIPDAWQKWEKKVKSFACHAIRGKEPPALLALDRRPALKLHAGSEATKEK